MIEYSTEAAQVSSVFTQFRNSINVYTEDKDKDKKFYVTLLTRLMSGTGYVINDVIPLGGCDVVINACMSDTDTSPKIYIVDGDINLMTTPKASCDHLFVLSRYCIENFVLDKDAFYSVFNEFDYVHTDNDIKAAIDYDEMMDSIRIPFMTLFHHFAVSQNEQGVFVLKDSSQFVNKQGCIDENKIAAEKTSIRNEVCANCSCSDEQFDNKLNDVSSTYDATVENLQVYVSGKDYLLPYVVNYAQKKLGLNIGYKREGWKYLSAKYCHIDPLESLKNAIINEIQPGNS